MSSPADFYNSLPPVSKSFGTLCVLTTLGYQLGVIKAEWLLLDFALVASKFQIWRLLTNFIFLGPFSMQFGVRILMIAKYGVQLEKGPFDKRTADFVWMFIVSMVTLLAMALALPTIRFYVGHALVFMLLYVWSREFANARVSLMGLVTLQGFWLPWALLAVNTMFGHPFLVDLLGIVVGHFYYFLTVLHPQATGHSYLKTPRWVYPLTVVRQVKILCLLLFFDYPLYGCLQSFFAVDVCKTETFSILLCRSEYAELVLGFLPSGHKLVKHVREMDVGVECALPV